MAGLCSDGRKGGVSLSSAIRVRGPGRAWQARPGPSGAAFASGTGETSQVASIAKRRVLTALAKTGTSRHASLVASRLFAPTEEAGRFGRDWDAYCRHVRIPWL